MNQFSIPMQSIQINASLSSSPTTDDSPTTSLIHLTNKLRLFHRMINSSRKKSVVSRSDPYSIVVHFLDDTERTFSIDRHWKGLDLFNEIADYLNLSEQRKFFGLFMENDNEDFPSHWIDLKKILRKQFTMDTSVYHLHFKVRFFLANPSVEIDDELTKYFYVLQMKKDFLSGKIWCSRTISAILASYIVQSKGEGMPFDGINELI